MLRLNHDIPIHMVFVHSDKIYFDEIKELIIEELKKGNISDYEKQYIFWHLNGRENRLPRLEFPVNYRKNIDILKEKYDFDIRM